MKTPLWPLAVLLSCCATDHAARAPDPLPSAAQEAATLSTLLAREHPLQQLGPKVLEAIATNPTPLLVYDLDQVAENYLRVRTALGQGEILYAVKVDPHPRVLRKLVELGSGFDAASRVEVQLALDAGSPPSRISYGNTVKSVDDIRFAFEHGVRLFVFDDLSELKKLAQHAPGAKVFVRLAMQKTNAHYPLTEKFGTDVDTAQSLLLEARRLGLVPYGVSFHVGSECYDAAEWREPVQRALTLFQALKAQGVSLQLLNVGGGFPKHYDKPVPSAEDIGKVVRETVNQVLPGVLLTLAAEPGRYIIGDAAVVASRVVLRAERSGKSWLHLDTGTYNGLNEAMYGIRYDVLTPGSTGAKYPFTLAGPTCDSADVLYRDLELSDGVSEGSVVVFANAGAYAASCSTQFNGFPMPGSVFLQ